MPVSLPVHWRVWGYVMNDLKALAGFRLATFAIPPPSWIRTGQNTLTPRSHSAESLEEQQVSTLVCRTYRWGPQNGAYRAATGPDKKKCLDTWIFDMFFRK